MNEWICREMSTSTGNSENGVLMRETELIRCKDCKWVSIIGYCDLLRIRIVDSYKYCAWAERKEE